MAREVKAPDGRQWVIGHRWVPRTPIWIGPRPGRRTADGRRKGSALDFLDPFAAIPDDTFGVIMLGISAMILFVVVGVPLLMFALDLALLALILLVGVIARIAFGRPWVIDARTEGPPAEHVTIEVKGWGASNRAIDAVAQRLEAGYGPEITPVG